MDIFIYASIVLASFLGLVIGIIISNMAFEEIQQISKYLKYLNIAIVPVIIFITTHNINKIYSIIFASLAIILIIIFREKHNNAWTYSCMGALLYVSTLSNETLNVAVLIFIYGVSIATINTSQSLKQRTDGKIKFSENVLLTKKVLGRYSYYLLVGMIFFVVFSYIL